jgi:hypothetical protein
MSFYTLAIYFWCAVAALGLTAPFIAVAVELAAGAIGDWLSWSADDEPVISSHPGPLSVP